MIGISCKWFCYDSFIVFKLCWSIFGVFIIILGEIIIINMNFFLNVVVVLIVVIER